MAISDTESYMRLALAEARKSSPKPTNYRVGALLVELSTGAILSTGYTLELPGNTHAEQCCLIKAAEIYSVPTERVGETLPMSALFTTVEPCSERLSGNTPCVERILAARTKSGSCAITTVYIGVAEPQTFVKANSAMARLEEAGIKVVHVTGLEDEILAVATAGHE